MLKGLDGFWPKLSESVKFQEVHSGLSISFSHIVNEKKSGNRKTKMQAKHNFFCWLKNKKGCLLYTICLLTQNNMSYLWILQSLLESLKRMRAKA